jgi:spermidine/putrescine transport system substrate-binding protein
VVFSIPFIGDVLHIVKDISNIWGIMDFMKKLCIWSFLEVVLAVGFAVSVHSADLKMYIWEDYISQELIDRFKEETGISVQQVHYDSDKTRDEIVASSRGKQFDIVLIDSIATQIFGKNNQLLAINKTEIPNYSHIDTQWQESCGNFGVPYFYGTVGILYDTQRYTEAPDSWKDLLEPESEHKGYVVMLEDLVDTIIPALLYLGYNINSENENELKAAYSLLEKQVPFVLNYKYALSNLKASGGKQRIDIALGYSGDQYSLNDATNSKNWDYVIPKEGSAVWVDCLSIPAWSEKRQEALKFINFLSDSKNAALNTEDIYYATPISAAKSFMSEEAAADPQLFLPEDLLKRLQPYRILSDNNMRQRGRIINALLKRHEAQ